MTAPAVVRRWNDPAPVRVEQCIPDPKAAADLGPPGGGAAQARIQAELVRIRRVAPLAAVLLTGLMVHAAIGPHLAVRGAAPDVLLVAVVAVAVGRGARTGAGFGFAAGLGADLFLATPLGTSALAYTLVGHALGRSSRPRSSSSAAALCGPDSPCFACRNGRLHGSEAPIEAAGRPSRVRRRTAVRRAALRRSVLVTAVGVGAGHLGTAVVATTIGGVPFPDGSVLVRIAGMALLSCPLGPLALAVLRRLGGSSAACL